VALQALLAEPGRELLLAKSAREALELLLTHDVGLALIDVHMPEIDGFELASMIRQHPRCQRTAIIFVSAVHLSDQDKVKGYQTGAVDYVSVPVVPEILRAKIRVFLELHRKTTELRRLNDELAVCAESAVHMVDARGMRRPDHWISYQLVSGSWQQLNFPAIVQPGVSYCLDPRFMAANLQINNSPPPAYYPTYLQPQEVYFPAFPYQTVAGANHPDGSGNPGAPRMQRISRTNADHSPLVPRPAPSRNSVSFINARDANRSVPSGGRLNSGCCTRSRTSRGAIRVRRRPPLHPRQRCRSAQPMLPYGRYRLSPTAAVIVFQPIRRSRG
jgi:CheY-like chemotaxis protein